MSGQLILVTGGARSGKSRFALGLGEGTARPCYIATAWDGDAEMSERIDRHRAERDPRWTTLEERTDLAAAIHRARKEFDADFILVECLTLWTSNMMIERNISTYEEVMTSVHAVVEAARATGVSVCLVTNEVGCGVVPAEPLGRLFRDLAGWVNQGFASAADRVVWTVSGIPVTVKPPAL